MLFLCSHIRLSVDNKCCFMFAHQTVRGQQVDNKCCFMFAHQTVHGQLSVVLCSHIRCNPWTCKCCFMFTHQTVCGQDCLFYVHGHQTVHVTTSVLCPYIRLSMDTKGCFMFAPNQTVCVEMKCCFMSTHPTVRGDMNVTPMLHYNINTTCKKIKLLSAS